MLRLLLMGMCLSCKQKAELNVAGVTTDQDVLSSLAMVSKAAEMSLESGNFQGAQCDVA